MGKKAKKAQPERLFENAPNPAETGPVECLGMTFANDEARRAHFTELLRQKLRDPEFRKTEGFPIGEDEDIINLSDPPYYTACPNPWLSDFITANQPAEERDDTAKEPFASDISEGKGHPLYNAHSYHTKVPHRAAMKYILHYTQPGDIILDGFCGTGMAGLAAQLCGDRSEVAAIGYSLDEDGIIRGEGGAAVAKLGVRRSILADLSPIATYIAYNYNTPTDVAQLVEEAEKICDDVETECGWMYDTIHSDGSRGHINCTVWSDVFECATCGSDVVYWDVAIDMRTADVLDEFPCPQCRALLSKRKAGKVMTTYFDTLLSRTVTTTKQVPVLISYTCNGKRYTKRPETSDLELIQRIQQSNIPYNVPSSRMMHSSDDTERWGDRWRAGSACFTHVHHLFTKRNLWVLGAFGHRIGRSRAKFLLSGIINRSTQMNRIHLRNFVFGGGGWNAGYMKGAIYTPSLPIETSIFEQWKDRLVSVKAAFARLPVNNSNIIISTQSTTGLSIPDNSVDYVFVDPPFGANLNYSELNFLWESWLGVWTNNEMEAVQSDFQKKGLTEYRLLMLSCFRNLYRVLKPGRWMTVEFSNTSAAVWNSIQVALSEAGFVVSNVSALDKKQGTFNAIRNSTSVKQDLVISAYKPTAQFKGDSRDFLDAEILIWSFVTSHLSYLPVAASSGKNVRVSPERDPRILFDQVVSFFVTHGQVIPISSHEFQLGLASRFVERDGMYFLPEQATAYDQMRLNAEGVQQQSLFVSDERSAIMWIRRELSQQPMKYQDLSPRFMKEAQRVWDRHEQPVELRAILEQSFVVDEQGTWRVPDPQKESDLEQIRHRALLKEFQQYLDTRGKLKVLRTEALRAGFKEAWQKKDYATIVTMAKRVPDAVIQEDQALLMYFDNASLMLGE